MKIDFKKQRIKIGSCGKILTTIARSSWMSSQPLETETRQPCQLRPNFISWLQTNFVSTWVILGGVFARVVENTIATSPPAIHESWVNGKTVNMLLLDVSGAFGNVSQPRLLHNLKKRRILEELVRWINSFLSGRTTVIHLDGYTSEGIEVNTGIPQGSPSSPILYSFYNADLLAQAYIRCEYWPWKRASKVAPTKFEKLKT